MIEEIILPDGTPATRVTSTYEGVTRVGLVVPGVSVHILPNADHKGFDMDDFPSHWDEDLQRVVPNGLGKLIEKGKDAGKSGMWWDADVAMWIGRSEPIDYKRMLDYSVKAARQYLGNESLHPVIPHIEAAEAFLKATKSDFLVDAERAAAKKLEKPLRDYADQQWRAGMAGSIRREKVALAEARKGKFIEKPAAQAIMKDAEYKTRKQRNRRWVDQFIKYQGKWLRICRVDLANQVASTIYGLDGAPPSFERWAKSIAYGVVATDEDWYIVDATTDG